MNGKETGARETEYVARNIISYIKILPSA